MFSSARRNVGRASCPSAVVTVPDTDDSAGGPLMARSSRAVPSSVRGAMNGLASASGAVPFTDKFTWPASRATVPSTAALIPPGPVASRSIRKGPPSLRAVPETVNAPGNCGTSTPRFASRASMSRFAEVWLTWPSTEAVICWPSTRSVSIARSPSSVRAASSAIAVRPRRSWSASAMPTARLFVTSSPSRSKVGACGVTVPARFSDTDPPSDRPAICENAES